jgi:drug/metabolite transporter (DMT)-like permease
MLGLILACFGSVFNVLTDASRKKILDRQYDAAVIGFWCKLVALGFYLLALVVVVACGFGLQLPPIGATLKMSPVLAFVLYLIFNALLEGTAILLNYRALQVSPLSFCVPFMALTPVFLLPIGKFFLHEQIATGMIVGVFLVVVGSLVINRQLVANGWLEPAKAMIREKGSRYMMIVAFLLACTAALDKWFVTSGGDAAFGERLSRSFTLSIGKSVILALFFVGLAWWRLRGMTTSPVVNAEKKSTPSGNMWTQAWRDVPQWIVLASFFEAIVLVLQLLAVQFTVAAVVISIKRSGILLACAVGWFLFKERGITDRVIGSCVMVSGVVIFFLTKPNAQGAALIGLTGALGVAALALAGMSVALYLTRDWHRTAGCAVAGQTLSQNKT